MKILRNTIIFISLFAIITPSVFATDDEPIITMGKVTYTSLGIDREGTMADIYGHYLSGNLINSGAVLVVASGEDVERLERMRTEFNNLNGGRGAYYEKTDAQGNKFWGYEKMDESKVLKPEYRIDASINVTRARHESEGNRQDNLQDISVTVRIYNVKTGELVNQSTKVRRNADPYANLQELGPKPTWMEKYITGYVREITYDDPLKMAIAEVSKTVIDKLSALNNQKNTSDVDRFVEIIEDRRIEETQIEVDDTPVGNSTAWGSPENWGTAYEGYFWLHIQDPQQYPNFWQVYNHSNEFVGKAMGSLPIGVPVDLRAYFNSLKVREYYQFLRKNKPNMPPLSEFLENIGAYQTNLGLTEPTESKPVTPEPANPLIQNYPDEDIPAEANSEENAVDVKSDLNGTRSPDVLYTVPR